MGEYWSVDECRWVTWPTKAPVIEDDEAQSLNVPQPRQADETASAPTQPR